VKMPVFNCGGFVYDGKVFYERAVLLSRDWNKVVNAF
jgi:hypothetical protein